MTGITWHETQQVEAANLSGAREMAGAGVG